jgi:hypothetical protein
MEDLVFTEVNALFDTALKNKAQWLTCSCPQCRLDTICYVLNRIQPKYIKSGRGLAHSNNTDYADKTQITADINRIALEGMKQVLSTQRPHSIEATNLPAAPVYNFPTFVGRILDGKTFEPVKDLDVILLHDGKPALSIDTTWENPYRISTHTPGTFAFWVKPEAATKEGANKVFSFELRVEKTHGYDELSYFFEIGLPGEALLRTAYSAEHSFMIPDLHLFPVEDGLENMQD